MASFTLFGVKLQFVEGENKVRINGQKAKYKWVRIQPDILILNKHNPVIISPTHSTKASLNQLFLFSEMLIL